MAAGFSHSAGGIGPKVRQYLQPAVLAPAWYALSMNSSKVSFGEGDLRTSS